MASCYVQIICALLTSAPVTAVAVPCHYIRQLYVTRTEVPARIVPEGT